jgi:four helix bundle protein
MNNEKRGYKNLIVFQKADELVLKIYEITSKFPSTEKFSLVDQMRRAAISVPANIAEGCGRRTTKERIQFFYTSRGSLIELEYYIDLSFKLNYIDKQLHNKLSQLRNDVGRLINGLITSLKNSV